MTKRNQRQKTTRNRTRNKRQQISIADEKTLQATVTGEAVQPTRLYYKIIDKKRLIDCFNGLRCMDFDPDKNRWVWLYTHESKTLKFETSYSSIPRKLRPVVIGSFFLGNKDELLLDLRSFERTVKAVEFFDKKLGKATAKITHAAVVNRFFDVQEQFPPNLDLFFNSREMEIIDPDKGAVDLESLLGTQRIDDETSDWVSILEERAKKPHPEIEKFPVYFYEEGITSLQTTLRMRHVMAFEHWKGNTDYTLFDVIQTMVSKYND